MVKTSIDKDFNFMMICAVRYALGRRTYAVSMVCDYISDIIPFMDKKSLAVIKRDIEETNELGDLCDWVRWMDLLKEITDEIKRKDK